MHDEVSPLEERVIEIISTIIVLGLMYYFDFAGFLRSLVAPPITAFVHWLFGLFSG
jgi:hypothetical protein